MPKKNSANLFVLPAACISLAVFCITSPEQTAKDTVAPVITLSEKTKTILIGEPWVNPSASATDNVDKDVSSRITVSGKIHNELIGQYKLVYSVSDLAGNWAFDTMNVQVVTDPLTAAYYPFTGDAKDYSGNSLDGAFIGADSPAVDRFAVSGSAQKFKGSYMNVPYTSKLDFAGAFSACAWAKSDRSMSAYNSTEGFILNMGFGAERDYAIYIHPTLGLTFRYNGKTFANTKVDILKWHHYAMVFTGDTLKAYIDGTLAGGFPTGIGAIDNNPFRVGCESKQTARYWYGCVDDVMLVSSALSGKRITELAHAGGFIPDSVIPADTVKDTSSTTNGLKATITGLSGNLSLKLTWDAVAGALGYGVYYNTGKSVTKNDYYRIATSNTKTFSSELTEGVEYTFAIVSMVNGVESPLSQPITVLFKP